MYKILDFVFLAVKQVDYNSARVFGCRYGYLLLMSANPACHYNYYHRLTYGCI